MFKKLVLLAAVCAAVGVWPSGQAQAAPVFAEGQFVITAAGASATLPVALTASAVFIDRIVIRNVGPVTSAVFVAAQDLSGTTAIDAFALGAAATLSQIPPGVARVTTEQVNVITGEVVIPTSVQVTNRVPIPVRDLVLTGYKQTASTNDTVIFYRIYGTAR